MATEAARSTEAGPQRLVRFNTIIVERQVLYGAAARMNRGRYSGSKVHRLIAERVVGIVEGSKVQPHTYAAEFLRQKSRVDPAPVYSSVRPECGCCQGQIAGQPISGLTESDVTCAKCAAGAA